MGDYKTCKNPWNRALEPDFFKSAKTVMEAFNTGGYCMRMKPKPPSVTLTPPGGCPQCATFKKSGKRSCCAPGGAWVNKCGSDGDPKFEHTWAEGMQACQGTRKFAYVFG